jgi:hypothetical protein
MHRTTPNLYNSLEDDVILHCSSKFIEIENCKIDEEAQEERRKEEGFMKKVVGGLDLSFS